MTTFHSCRFLATGALALLLSACATSGRVDAQWSDPSLGAQSRLLQGATVLVACEARDVAVRNICQDRLAEELRLRGGNPVFVPPETQLYNDRALDTQLVPAARTLNARALLVMTLTPVATDTEGSGLSLGIGGFGFGRGSAIGGGISAPVGETRVVTGFSGNGRVTDVASGRLVWTASAAAPPSSDLDAQCAALSSAVLNSAERSGLF